MPAKSTNGLNDEETEINCADRDSSVSHADTFARLRGSDARSHH